MVNNNDAVIEFLLNQLRQQLTNNPYKQQCEDLAHEVLSLKNQLRDASALVAELQKELEHTGNEYRRAIDYALSDAPEQSGCRKDDTQECEHNWVLDNRGDYYVCYKCGKQEAELNDCRHANTVGLRKGFAPGFTKKCLDCGAKLK